MDSKQTTSSLMNGQLGGWREREPSVSFSLEKVTYHRFDKVLKFLKKKLILKIIFLLRKPYDKSIHNKDIISPLIQKHTEFRQRCNTV